jgi:levansucrase
VPKPEGIIVLQARAASPQPSPKPRTTAWSPAAVAAIVEGDPHTIPPVPAGAAALLPGLDLWDLWPVQLADGTTARFAGDALWMILSAPVLSDPDLRHNVARIRLVRESASGWHDCGNLLPDGFNPGSREWAGSALFDPATAQLTLFYTVAGFPGEERASFAQRLFQTSARLDWVDGAPQLGAWSEPVESIRADGVDYVVVDQTEGVPGMIKGFRDPAHFRDPADGSRWLVFTGSLQASASAWNGCIGLARAVGEGVEQWELLPPLVSADDLCNEQERPHLIARDGRYYLFWSTQRRVFAPHGPTGPNGLYGMVADAVTGPYRPLNGTGLIAANPPEAPIQTYSWWVDADLVVHGFDDFAGVGPGGFVDDPEWRRAHFGGVPAPRFRIVLDGDRAWVDKAA